MSMSDPIADMVVRIRNAAERRHASVRVPKSALKANIAKVLLEEGYLEQIREEKEGVRAYLVLDIKYQKNRRSVIRGLQRESRPGGRRYVTKENAKSVASGFGTLIISTSKGVMTGYQARQIGVGGEPLMSIW